MEDGLYYYEKCLKVAQKSEENDEEEAEISYKIGNLLFTRFNNYEKCLGYQ